MPRDQRLGRRPATSALRVMVPVAESATAIVAAAPLAFLVGGVPLAVDGAARGSVGAGAWGRRHRRGDAV